MQLNKLPALSMSIKFFYIANGSIHLKEEGQPARLIESRFGASLIDRVERIRERNAWKCFRSICAAMADFCLPMAAAFFFFP